MNTIVRNLLIGLCLASVIGAGIYWYVSSSNKSDTSGATASVPSLERPYVITTDMSDQAKSILQADVVDIKKQLKESPTDFEEWLDLGLHYKMAGDFEGARQVWEYVSVKGSLPTMYVALGNLGNLYLYFIKDYPKAEEYYRKAIALKPDEISYYVDMYTLYHYAYKTGTGADAAILDEGLKANPGNKDLLTRKAQLEAGK